ncbi:MAG: glycosyltransferase family 4 protein [Desulfovibrio sp.]|nr:glycosyltransferase family 4 protein [Desulfovibrio sp.]
MDIGVITREFSPLTRNGGIGTAMRFLCEALAKAGGHRLTVYYTGRPSLRMGAFARQMQRRGIAFRPIIAPLGLLLHDQRRRSRAVAKALPGTRHDCLLFHEFMADGWCYLQQRGPGAPACGMVTHGSAMWVDEGNGVVVADGPRAQVYAMERQCCEQADFLVSPSRYLLDWMRGRGWKLPAQSQVIPNFTSPYAESAETASPRRGRDTAPPRELVFFGRLEERKGLRVFCDALLLLPPELLAGRRVTFLGREGGYTPEQVRDWLAPLGEAEPRLDFHTNLDAPAARAYLCGEGRLAVMPSLRENSPCVVSECLESGIPFLASASGGGPELARPEDADCFVEPDAAKLASRLGHILGSGPPGPALPRHAPQELLAAWQEVLGRAAAEA